MRGVWFGWVVFAVITFLAGFIFGPICWCCFWGAALFCRANRRSRQSGARQPRWYWWGAGILFLGVAADLLMFIIAVTCPSDPGEKYGTGKDTLASFGDGRFQVGMYCDERVLVD